MRIPSIIHISERTSVFAIDKLRSVDNYRLNLGCTTLYYTILAVITLGLINNGWIHRKSELTSTVIFGCYVLKYTLCGNYYRLGNRNCNLLIDTICWATLIKFYSGLGFEREGERLDCLQLHNTWGYRCLYRTRLRIKIGIPLRSQNSWFWLCVWSLRPRGPPLSFSLSVASLCCVCLAGKERPRNARQR